MCGASRASKGPFRATHLRPTCFAGLMNTPTEPYSWAELAAIALHRQFPAADSVAELVEQVGPIQSQAARAPFLGIAARLTSGREPGGFGTARRGRCRRWLRRRSGGNPAVSRMPPDRS